MNISNKGMKRENFIKTKYLHTKTKKIEKNLTIETKFDKHGNKFSMYETVK